MKLIPAPWTIVTGFHRLPSAWRRVRPLLLGALLAALPTIAAPPYKVVQRAESLGEGGIDYVTADSAERRLYIPRGNQVLVFDLDTLKPVGAIPEARARGVAVDPVSHHGFCSSSPVQMWDTRSLKRLKSIPVQGHPDAILFEPFTQRIYVLSHATPNVTVLEGKDGSLAGTFDLGGEPEQAVSDGRGKVFIPLEDKDEIAVVDAKAMAVTAHHSLGGKGGGPAGLALDPKSRTLFACCRNPAVCVMVGAEDGAIRGVLPIGQGVDSALFNLASNEAFSSQRDGTLTVLARDAAGKFQVAQTVATEKGAKTCTLDAKSGRVVLITTAPGSGPAPAGAPAASLLQILVVGR